MRHLDLTITSPAENLACDEALLDWCESGDGVECLRFWESPEPFVVVGYANKVETEVNVAACEARKIPILADSTWMEVGLFRVTSPVEADGVSNV